MRKGRALLVLLGSLLLVGAPGQAEARGGHRSHGHHYGHRSHGGHHHYGHRSAHFSLWLGPLWYAAYAYPHHYSYYPYYHETAVIVEERTVYVERPESAATAGSWWYYCESSGGYYPEVASCPKGWVKVPPRPED